MNRHDAWYGHFDLLQNERRAFFDPDLDRLKTVASGFSFLFWVWLLSFPIEYSLYFAKLRYGKSVEELIHGVPDLELFWVVLFLGFTLLTAFLKTWGTWQISRSPSKMEGHETGIWMFISWTVGILLETCAAAAVLSFAAMHPGRTLDDDILFDILRGVEIFGCVVQGIAGILFFVYAFRLAALISESRSSSALKSSVCAMGAVILSYFCLPFITIFGFGTLHESGAVFWSLAAVATGSCLWFFISLLCAYRFLAADLRRYIKTEQIKEAERNREE